MQRLNAMAISASNLLERITAVPLIIIGGLMLGVVLVGTFWRYVLNDPLDRGGGTLSHDLDGAYRGQHIDETP